MPQRPRSDFAVLSLSCLIAVWVCSGMAQGATWHVDASGPGGDGTSWGQAFQSVQDALAAAGSGDEIWVARGVYAPTSGADREISFQLKDGVALYGGFLGDELARTDRRWSLNPTVLSGEIGGAGVDDNSYHVVIGAGNARLDGFTIEKGNANKPLSVHCAGGGMYNDRCAPTVANCTFRDNRAETGAGVYNVECTPVFLNCVFENNIASYDGGGMQNDVASAPSLTTVVFRQNTAADHGGAVENYGEATPVFDDCEFSENTAAQGGGMSNAGGSTARVTNSLFLSNTATHGDAAYNEESDLVIEATPIGTNGDAIAIDGGGSVTVNGQILSVVTPPPATPPPAIPPAFGGGGPGGGGGDALPLPTGEAGHSGDSGDEGSTAADEPAAAKQPEADDNDDPGEAETGAENDEPGNSTTGSGTSGGAEQGGGGSGAGASGEGGTLSERVQDFETRAEYLGKGQRYFSSDIRLGLDVGTPGQRRQARFAPGECLCVHLHVMAGTRNPAVDAFVALQLPDGYLVSMTGYNTFETGLRPIAPGWLPLSLEDLEVLRLDLPADLPAGEYTFFFGVADEDGDIAFLREAFTFAPPEESPGESPDAEGEEGAASEGDEADRSVSPKRRPGSAGGAP